MSIRQISPNQIRLVPELLVQVNQLFLGGLMPCVLRAAAGQSIVCHLFEILEELVFVDAELCGSGDTQLVDHGQNLSHELLSCGLVIKMTDSLTRTEQGAQKL